MEYDISNIPTQFIDRIGELKEGHYSAEAIKNLEEGENNSRSTRFCIDHVRSSSHKHHLTFDGKNQVFF